MSTVLRHGGLNRLIDTLFVLTVDVRRQLTRGQLVIGFLLLLGALWHTGRLQDIFVVSAVAWVIIVVCIDLWIGLYSFREMALNFSKAYRSWWVALAGIALGIAILTLGSISGVYIPRAHLLLRPLIEYWVWAIAQQSVLLIFFFVRLERLYPTRYGPTIAATSLFTVAHLPNPTLTIFCAIGGLIFCEIFRKYRSIFCLALMHAAIGLSIRVAIEGNTWGSMRVGVGYVRHFSPYFVFPWN
jgi:hypothetical protein